MWQEKHSEITHPVISFHFYQHKFMKTVVKIFIISLKFTAIYLLLKQNWIWLKQFIIFWNKKRKRRNVNKIDLRLLVNDFHKGYGICHFHIKFLKNKNWVEFLFNTVTRLYFFVFRQTLRHMNRAFKSNSGKIC